MTTRTKYMWVKFRECGEILCGKRFFNLNVTAYKSYVSLVILCGSVIWCLREIVLEILMTGRCIVRAVCGVQLNNRKTLRIWCWC